MNYTELTGK